MKDYFWLLFFFSVSGFGAEYVNPIGKFTLQYDETVWEVIPPKPEVAGAEVDQTMAEKTLATLQRKKADDKYHARFSVVSDSLKKFRGKGKSDLDAYKEHAVEFLKSQQFYILSQETVRLPGVETPVIEVVGNQRNFGLTFRQLIFVKGDSAYLLTAASRKEKYDEYLPDLKKVAESFHFLKETKR